MCYQTAIRPRRTSDDVFFVTCDRLALQSSDSIAISYIEDDYEEDANKDRCNNATTGSNSAVNAKDDNTYGKSQKSKKYHYDKQIQSITQDVDHFNYHLQSIPVDQHQCSQCHIIYTNEHLLDLHIQEIHDSYFQTKLLRQSKNHHHSNNGNNDNSNSDSSSKPQYACLISRCKHLCWNDQERLKHLMNEHGYPNWFRFNCNNYNNRKNKNDNYDRIYVDNSKSRKTIQWWHNKRMNYSQGQKYHEDHHLHDVLSQQNHDLLMNKRHKIEQKKERKKRINATIPCRFYNSKSGCWRGDNCMFLHSKQSNTSSDNCNVLINEVDKIVTNGDINMAGDTHAENNPIHDNSNNNTSQTMDMDICKEIDILSNQITSKAKITIPNNISFGRRRRRC